MPGPSPKHPSVRARVNKASTRATLTEPDPDEVFIPELPPMRLVERKRKNEDGHVEKYTVEVPWRLETQEWWEDIWSSPMAAEFHSSDKHGLYRLAVLVDEFWSHPSTQANVEIRLAQKDYGLTPLDRRRLEWTIASAEKATDGNRKRRGASEPDPKGDEGGIDPRLHIVS